MEAIFYSLSLSMAVVFYFCKRADNIEFKEKYGHDKSYFKSQIKYMRGEDWKR
jgi:hypothetical protein